MPYSGQACHDARSGDTTAGRHEGTMKRFTEHFPACRLGLAELQWVNDWQGGQGEQLGPGQFNRLDLAAQGLVAKLLDW